MNLIDGKKIAAELRNELKVEVDGIKKKFNKVPGLTVILIGDFAPSLIYVNNKEKSEKYYLEKLDYILNESVKSHLQSDVPVGVFLSGGLDSSLLSAIATNHHYGKLKTYSVGFKETK